MTIKRRPWGDLSKLSHHILDTLRRIVDWTNREVVATKLDKSLIQEGAMWDTAGVVGDLMDENHDPKGGTRILTVLDDIKGGWGLFDETEKGFLKLNKNTFGIFSKDLDSALKGQPIGYINKLAELDGEKRRSVKIFKKNAKVFVQVGSQKPILIAADNTRQGKMLLWLSSPEIGLGKSLEGTYNAITISRDRNNHSDGYTSVAHWEGLIRNTMKEIQSKMSQKAAGGILSIEFPAKNVVRLRVD